MPSVDMLGQRVEIVEGGVNALEHHFGPEHVGNTSFGRFVGLADLVEARSRGEDVVPVVLSYDQNTTKGSNYSASSVIALVGSGEPLFRSTTTVDERTEYHNRINSLRLVADRAVFMAGGLFVPKDRISAIHESNGYPLRWIQGHNKEMPETETLRIFPAETNVFITRGAVVAVGRRAVERGIMHKLRWGNEASRQHTVAVSRKLFELLGIDAEEMFPKFRKAMGKVTMPTSMHNFHGFNNHDRRNPLHWGSRPDNESLIL